MLQTIRERAQGWVAWVIVILISIPFAFWGVQSYFGFGSETVVATVEGTDITERELDYRYRDARARLREQLGSAFRPEMFDDAAMREQVLEQMIREYLVFQASYELGLRASDPEIRAAVASNPAFQNDGMFDKDTYARMLELQGTSPVEYEKELRARIVGTQLSRSVMATEFLLDTELEEAVRLDEQQRRVALVRVPRSNYLTEESIPEEEVAEYYAANRSDFLMPERVRVRYLLLDGDTIAAGEAAGEEELRERYEAELERFTQPERRRVRHILVALDADADEAEQDAAKRRVDEIRERILSGEEFGALAEILSEDPGSAEQGGDLGFIEPGFMEPTFEQVAFSVEEGQLSDPVRSSFGYHLIEVTEIEPAVVQAFEEVRDALAAELEKRGSEARYYDWAERLANLAYESPDSLEPAAEALGLVPQTSDWFDRAGGEGILAHPKVIAAAFSEDVLAEGNNSALIEPDADRLRAVVLRVIDHQEAAAKPLEEVKEEIAAILRNERASKAAADEAAEMVRALESGADVAAVAGDRAVEELGLISRDTGGISAEIRDYAFKMSEPESGAATYGSLSLENGDGTLVILSEVVDGDLPAMEEETTNRLREQLAVGIGRHYYQNLLADLKRRAAIEYRVSASATEEE